MEKHCWREMKGCVRGREGESRDLRGAQLGWENVEEKEQQRWRWDGSKALWRGEERGRGFGSMAEGGA